jgi:hypothetical protein
VEQREATMLFDVERASNRQLNALLGIDRRSGQMAVHCEGSITEGQRSSSLGKLAEEDRAYSDACLRNTRRYYRLKAVRV